MKRKKLLALLLCLGMALTLLAMPALADSIERYGNGTVVSTRSDEFGNLCVAGYTVPAELFYYAGYQSGQAEAELAFRGGAFNFNSAACPVRAYSPAARLAVPMICVWDYAAPPAGGYPDNITVSGGVVSGTAREGSDSWQIRNLQADFLPVYADRAAFTELVLPMSLVDIGNNAVQDCAKLEALRFYDLANSRLERIGDGAFQNCPKLSSVEFPDTLTTIREDAFLNCPSLKTVTVPASVTKLMQHSLGYTTDNGYQYEKVPGFTIRGSEGSEAQRYAERCGFAFTAAEGAAAETWQGTGVTSMDNFTEMPQAAYTPGQFSDVDESAWYGADKTAAIRTAYELRIVKGKGDGAFDPRGNVLLSEALKMAAVVHSIYRGGNGLLKAQSGEKWYAPYVDYCVAQGLIQAGDFSQNYSRPATRAEMAYIFANTLPDAELAELNEVRTLPDVNAETPHSAEIFTMYRCGALRGNDAYGTFTPNANITRAEAAAIIARVALPGARLRFTLQEAAAPAESGGLYTPYMWVEDLAALKAVYTERVWGLYDDMYVYMDAALARQLFDADYYQDWVPMAVDVYASYNENDDRLMAYQFTNRSTDFEMDAILASAAAAPRASAAARGYVAQFDAILAAIVKRGMTERETLLAIHDWLIANVAYDVSFTYEDSYHAYGPLNNGVAVCQGYAELFYYLAARAGIECYTVGGLASSSAGMTDWGSHMWNLVYLSGDETPYYVDVTYDDPIPDTTTGRRTYFMVSAEMLSADHQW